MAVKSKAVAKNAIYNMFYKTVVLIFPMLTSMYVSRVLQEDRIGKVAYAQNIASYFLALALLGFSEYGTREMANVAKDREKTNIVFSELFCINILSTTLATVLYILLVCSRANLRVDFWLYMATGLVIFSNYANIDWLYRGQEEYGFITGRSTIVKIVSLLSMLLFVHTKKDFVLYALLTSMSTVYNNAVSIFRARKYVSFTFQGLNLKRHMESMLELAGVAFFGNLYNKLDTTMLGKMADDASVGYYFIASKIIVLAMISCQSVSEVIFPKLSRMYEEKDNEKLESLVEKGLQFLIIISLPASMGIALLGKEIVVALYGRHFLMAGATLQIFAPMMIIRPMADLICYRLLISIKMEKKRLFASILTSGVNFNCNLLLIPRWKQNGAAIASILSELVVNAILFYYVRQQVKIRVKWSIFLKTLLATAMMSIVIMVSKLCPISGAILSLAWSTFIGIMTYFLVSVVARNEAVITIFQKIREIIKKEKRSV